MQELKDIYVAPQTILGNSRNAVGGVQALTREQAQSILSGNNLSAGAITELTTGTYDADNIYTGANQELADAPNGSEYMGADFYYKKVSNQWHQIKKKSRPNLNLTIAIVTDEFPTANDQLMAKDLVEQGFTVTFVEDTVVAAGAGVYDAVLVSVDAGSTTVADKYNEVTYGVVLMEDSIWDDMRLTDSRITITITELNVTNTTHPIMTNSNISATGVQTLFSTAEEASYGTSVNSALTTLAEDTGSLGPVIGALDTGELLQDEVTPSPGRRVIFGVETNWWAMTDDFKSVLYAALRWAAGDI